MNAEIPVLPEMRPLALQDRQLRAEASAVKEVLANAEALGVTGGSIEIEGQVEAFTLGELLNPETVVIHIEKANAAFHGLYHMINQQFLEQVWSDIECVNREQDLGVPGLRKAKESYLPHHMVEKFVVRCRGAAARVASPSRFCSPFSRADSPRPSRRSPSSPRARGRERPSS